MRILIVATALLGLGFGCKKDREMPPAAPGGGKHGSTASGIPKDGGGSGSASDGDDAGIDGGRGFDGGVSTVGASRDECLDVSPAQFLDDNSSSDGRLLNGVRSPTDFPVTRVVATWLESCVEPTIVIEMTEGACSGEGEEHRLQIQLDVLSIQSGEIHSGLNTLSAEPDDHGARFIYFRPSRLRPEGVWGTCAGAPGTLDFVDEPQVNKAGRLEARFTLTLASCDGSSSDELIVQGNFDVELARGLEDVCPMK